MKYTFIVVFEDEEREDAISKNFKNDFEAIKYIAEYLYDEPFENIYDMWDSDEEQAVEDLLEEFQMQDRQLAEEDGEGLLVKILRDDEVIFEYQNLKN